MKSNRSKQWWPYLLFPGALVVGVGAALALREKPAPAEAVHPAVWYHDLTPALAAAKSQHKDVLVEFSTPDSDSASGVEKQLLASGAFGQAVGADFVLVRMAPSEDMSPAEVTRLSTCAEHFAVARFPTFVLMDADAMPYARTETVTNQVAVYQAEFKQLQGARVRRDLFLTQAAKATGAERALQLEQALLAVGSFATTDYVDVQRQIVELDAGNEAGLKAKYEPGLSIKQMEGVVQHEIYPLADQGNYQAAIARIDRLIADAKPAHEQLQLLLAFKGQLYYSLGDRQRATALLNDAIAVDPTSESADRARAAKSQLVGG